MVELRSLGYRNNLKIKKKYKAKWKIDDGGASYTHCLILGYWKMKWRSCVTIYTEIEKKYDNQKFGSIVKTKQRIYGRIQDTTRSIFIFEQGTNTQLKKNHNVITQLSVFFGAQFSFSIFFPVFSATKTNENFVYLFSATPYWADFVKEHKKWQRWRTKNRCETIKCFIFPVIIFSVCKEQMNRQKNTKNCI